MTLIRRILSNPAALVGLVRAILLAMTTWGVGQLAPASAQSIIDLLTAVLPLLSLALTGVSATATDAKIQQALNTPVPGSAPADAPPAT